MKNKRVKAKACALSSSVAAEAAVEKRKLLPLGAMVVAGLLGASDTVLAEEEKTLSAVTVTANAEPPPPDGLRATKTRVGRVEQDPHDLPQSIVTVTRSLMDEQETNTLREALRNVPGISFNAAEGGRSGDNMMLRGFYTFGDIYLDGIRDTAQYNRETFNLERVEVLRGAAAMLFGRGQAGGVINQVSKTPMLYGINTAGVGVGTDGYAAFNADLNQRIGDTTAIRINMMAREEDSARSNPVSGTTPHIQRAGFAPSISFGLGTEHEVNLSYYYLTTSDRPDYGVPFNSATKRPNEAYAKANAYWGVNGNFDNSDTNIVTLNYLYTIAPDTQWRTVLRGANYKRSYWAVAPQGGAPTAYSLASQAKTRETDTDNFAFQSDYSTTFMTFGLKNEFLAGFEYLYEDNKRWGLRNLGTATRPIYQSGQFTGAPSTYTGNSYSFFVQDALEFVPNWKALVGIRRDEIRADYVSVAGTTSNAFSGNFGEWSFRTGISWQPDPAQHYYLSYSDTFSPTADLYQLSGSAYPPERGEVVELGAKWLLFDGDLALRTAIFSAEKTWERSTDLDSPQYSILTKKRRTNGVEVEVAGRITDKWEVFGGLAIMSAEILEVAPGANRNFLYQTPRNTPEETANLWTTYQLFDGWKIGGGVEFKSERYGYQPAAAGTAAFAPNIAPSYTVWNAMVAYEQPKYNIKLNVQNVFDELYYDAIYDNGGFVYVGQPRRFILSAEYKF